MLKMIIADDEYIVRDGLKNIIPWEQFGIDVVGEAADGQEALDLCLELKPDILFTDIRMPIMDGLEVAMELHEMGSKIKIIIVSGIQDFNYAKTALNINAEGYILKPVKLPELKDTVQKVVNGINFEIKKKHELQNLQQQLHKSLPIIREKFIMNWILGVYKDEKEIMSNLEFLNIPFNFNEALIVSVLQIDDYYKVVKDLSEKDKHLMFFSISNIMNEVVENYNAGVCSYVKDNEFIVIFNQSTHANNKCRDICDEISQCVNKFLQIQISIGIGREVNNILHVTTSYKDALTALQYGFYTGKNSVLDINDINNINEESLDRKDVLYSDLFELGNQIINSMKLGNLENIEVFINKLFNSINSIKNLPIDYIQSICFELIYSSSRAIFELNENIDNIIKSRSELLDIIYKAGNIQDLEATIKATFIELTSYFSKKYNQKNNKIIAKIKDIIEKKFKENIGVQTITDEVFLSPNYLSLIFKQETGETITEYITKIRIEKAKELLKNSDLKVLEIAEQVGFENAHYFSTVFKKYTGIHAQKYRTNTSE